MANFNNALLHNHGTYMTKPRTRVVLRVMERNSGMGFGPVGAVVAEYTLPPVTKMTDLYWPCAIQRHFRDVMYTKPVDRGA